MIYSDDINKVCGVCRYFSAEDGGICARRKRAADESGEGCKKFEYDILKKPARRKRRLKSDYSDEDFKL